MDENHNDVKAQEGSSPSDVKPSGADSSSASTDGKQETPLSIAMAAAGVSSDAPDKVKSEDKTTQEKAPAPELGSKIEPDASEEQKPEGDEEESTDGEDDKSQDEETEESEEASPEDKQLEKTFAQSKRFQELNTKVKELEPLAKQAEVVNNYCAEKGITPDQFRDALYVASLLNDPSKVDELKRIMTPLFESLGFASGDKLPDDLQKDVNEGVINVERARELARYRAQTTMQSHMQVQKEAQSLKQQINVALSQWEGAKEKSDPDWKKRLPVINALYQAKVSAHQGGLRPQDHVAYAEQAYLEAKGFSQSFIPRPTAKKVLRSNGSSKQTKVMPKTPMEVAEAVASGRKVDFS